MSRTGKQTDERISLLRAPHVTEKSATLNDASNAYVFKVANNADKVSVMKAVAAAYKVTPVRVNMLNVPPKRVVMRGKVGSKPGYKKAIVSLKKGDTIEIV